MVKHNKDDEAYDLGISQGVGALRIEQAMAERKIPPLKPFTDTRKIPGATLPPMKRILIVSTWRTGSSFLGEVIQSVPGVFYSYEPLHYFDHHPGSKQDLIRSIFKCQFTGEYLQHVNGVTEGGQDFMRRNRRVWEACHHDKTLCYRPDFVGQLCSYFPVQLIKVVRLRMKDLASFAADDWKVIYLARDPRGVMASRANLTWCRSEPACGDVQRLCDDVSEDLQWLERLKNQFPDRYYLLKFEDLTANVEIETQKLFQFLQIPITVPVKVFLTTHTRSSEPSDKNIARRKHDPFSTNRQTKSVANEWRTKLSKNETTFISKICNKVLNNLGYTVV